MLTVFVISGFVVAGVLIVFTNLLSISQKTQGKLKAEITAMQDTETRFVLIKDRLAKIGQLEKKSLADTEVKKLRGIAEDASASVKISEITLDTKEIVLTVNFGSSRELGYFISKLEVNPDLKDIRLDSIKYSLGKGYEAQMTL